MRAEESLGVCSALRGIEFNARTRALGNRAISGIEASKTEQLRSKECERRKTRSRAAEHREGEGPEEFVDAVVERQLTYAGHEYIEACAFTCNTIGQTRRVCALVRPILFTLH